MPLHLLPNTRPLHKCLPSYYLSRYDLWTSRRSERTSRKPLDLVLAPADSTFHLSASVSTVWQAIGEATFNAGKTIPAAFGSRVSNIALEKAHMIAETYSIWTLYIAPILLKGRFRHQRYYKHFIQLVKLLMVCFKFEISQEDVDNLETGFQSWVIDYEWCIFLFSLYINT